VAEIKEIKEERLPIIFNDKEYFPGPLDPKIIQQIAEAKNELLRWLQQNARQPTAAGPTVLPLDEALLQETLKELPSIDRVAVIGRGDVVVAGEITMADVDRLIDDVVVELYTRRIIDGTKLTNKTGISIGGSQADLAKNLVALSFLTGTLPGEENYFADGSLSVSNIPLELSDSINRVNRQFQDIAYKFPNSPTSQRQAYDYFAAARQAFVGTTNPETNQPYISAALWDDMWRDDRSPEAEKLFEDLTANFKTTKSAVLLDEAETDVERDMQGSFLSIIFEHEIKPRQEGKIYGSEGTNYWFRLPSEAPGDLRVQRQQDVADELNELLVTDPATAAQQILEEQFSASDYSEGSLRDAYNNEIERIKELAENERDSARNAGDDAATIAHRVREIIEKGIGDFDSLTPIQDAAISQGIPYFEGGEWQTPDTFNARVMAGAERLEQDKELEELSTFDKAYKYTKNYLKNLTRGYEYSDAVVTEIAGRLFDAAEQYDFSTAEEPFRIDALMAEYAPELEGLEASARAAETYGGMSDESKFVTELTNMGLIGPDSSSGFLDRITTEFITPSLAQFNLAKITNPQITVEEFIESKLALPVYSPSTRREMFNEVPSDMIPGMRRVTKTDPLAQPLQRDPDYLDEPTGTFAQQFRSIGEESPDFLSFLFPRELELERDLISRQELERQEAMEKAFTGLGAHRPIVPGAGKFKLTDVPEKISSEDPSFTEPAGLTFDPTPRNLTDAAKALSAGRPVTTPGAFFEEKLPGLREEFERSPQGIMSMLRGEPKKRKARTIHTRARV
jgi:hypothetical protein